MYEGVYSTLNPLQPFAGWGFFILFEIFLGGFCCAGLSIRWPMHQDDI